MAQFDVVVVLAAVFLALLYRIKVGIQKSIKETFSPSPLCFGLLDLSERRKDKTFGLKWIFV